MTFEREPSISAFISSDGDSGLISVDFVWAASQPNDVYTIPKGDVSVALGKHLLVRPTGLNWRLGESIGSEAVIFDCFGEELYSSLTDLRDSATTCMSGLDIVLSKENRINIAKLQRNSASTPHNLIPLLDGFIKLNSEEMALEV